MLKMAIEWKKIFMKDINAIMLSALPKKPPMYKQDLLWAKTAAAEKHKKTHVVAKKALVTIAGLMLMTLS